VFQSRGMCRCGIGSIKDAHDPGLGSSVGGCLGHLPLGVHLAAVDGQPEGAEQEDAHCHHNENDSLSLFAAKVMEERFQIR